MKINKGGAIVLAICTFAMAENPAMAQQHHPGAATSERSQEAQAFQADNDIAMARMMAAMHVEPTGDVDRDFLVMMIPHHQGAIDMAKALLRSGRNETVRRLAQEIIVTQEDEIRAMRMALADQKNAAIQP